MAIAKATATAAAAAISICILSFFLCKSVANLSTRQRRNKLRSKTDYGKGLIAAIGNTPLIRINSLSDATGCEILAKAEFLNPGGSVKDRVAVKIIEEALDSGNLVRGGVVTEGSAGSTAVSLATVAPAYGCKCHVVIPDDAAIEKVCLEALPVMSVICERTEIKKEAHGGFTCDRWLNILQLESSCNSTQAEVCQMILPISTFMDTTAMDSRV